MGLDWDPLAKARDGHDRELVTLVRRLGSRDAGTTLERIAEITEPVFATLGAPRVGIDPAADAWLRSKVEPGNYEAARAEMVGYHVLDLLPDCDGFPPYSNYPLYSPLARYSFRAQFLADVTDIVGQELNDRAYCYQLPDELEAYGEELFARARKFARKRRIMEVELTRDARYELDTSEGRAHIVIAAARWCLYWARRGHGLAPWF